LQDIQHAGALVGEDLRGRSLVDDLSIFYANDFGVEDERFFDVVRDGEDGYSVVESVLPHLGEQDIAQGAVDSGERLVQEKQGRCGYGEGAREVDALTLAAGEIAGKSVS